MQETSQERVMFGENTNGWVLENITAEWTLESRVTRAAFQIFLVWRKGAKWVGTWNGK